MSNMLEENKIVREKTIKEMMEKDVIDERLLYTIPYDKFYLTQPKNEKEVALELKNVILVAKEKISNQYGETKRVFELYNEKIKKIGIANTDERFKCDKEIIEDLIQNQQKKLDELGSGLKVAGADSLDNQGRIESYFELINRKLVTMNEEQKEKNNKIKFDYEKAILDIDENNIEGKYKEKEKSDQKQREEIENNNLNNKENAETAKLMIQEDMGIEIQQITPIQDDLFYDNNPEVQRNRAFLVMDEQKKPQIVISENGEFKKSNGFGNSIAESGRTNIIRHDETNMEEKNTYGAIYSSRYPNDVRYTVEIGTYGEAKLLEQRHNKGAKIEKSDEWFSREVQTNNTDYEDVNREGNTIKNITRESFKIGQGYTDDSHIDSVNEKMKKINKDRHENNETDFTVEDVADSIDMKVSNAIEKIKSELNEREIEITSDEEENIDVELRKSLDQTEIVYCDEKIEEFCNNYISQKEQEEKIEDEEYEGPTLANTHPRTRGI